MADRRQQIKTCIEVIVIVAVIIATKYAFLRGYINQAGLQQLISQAGLWAVPSFIVFTAIGQLVFAPPLLFIGSGALAFGEQWGAFYATVGFTLGSGAAFLLGRTVLKDFAQQQKQGLLKKVDECVERNRLLFVIGLKLAVFANPPSNYVAGLTSVRLWDYVLGSLLALWPGVFMIASVFEGWMYSGSWLSLLAHPALIWMGLLRLAGVVILVVLAKWYGKEKLAAPDYSVTQ